MGRRSLLALGAAIATLVLPASATALVTLGQVGPLGQVKDCSPAEGRDYAQQGGAAGASYVVPTAGVLTSWSTISGATGSLGLKVYRPFAGAFLVVAADGPKELPAKLPSTFGVSIPVQAGDLVGLEVPPFGGSGCVYNSAAAGDVVAYRVNRVPVGGSLTFDKTEPGRHLNLSATLLPAPAITSVTPVRVPVTGGSVRVNGGNFASVAAVSVGATPVPFSVESENAIVATAPATTTLGAVPLTVTTAAGTASGSFVYEGCRVPQLRGKKLKAVRKAAKRSDCRLGRVTKRGGATARTGKVTRQSLKPGSVLAPGTKIKVTLKP